ncbi:uncharacterized protein LOC111330657 isoform X3 [Stylophora pistillata]|uniref:uncharacterized protein LOC111330657 isoform X3 n=1 Tax=Stylophora pistillata TaxID=50429 RepID=UPI000C0505C3|nr:uncharacterized protein LOC111330657 isoform X3 [Stylophora pistillata]
MERAKKHWREPRNESILKKFPKPSRQKSSANSKMKPKFWLTVVVTFLMSWMGIISATDQCHLGERSIRGIFLRGHTFLTFRVGLPAECYRRCENEVTCQSINFVIGQNICELNNRTKEARPEDIMQDQTRYYVKRLKRVPLGSIKEFPAETCSEIQASEGNDTAYRKYWISSDGNGKAIEAYCQESWQKINGKEPVCFGAKGEDYGAFVMTKSGRLKTMKLIYRSGWVNCNPTYDDSYWGCKNPAYGNMLMTVVTNDNKKAVFPPSEELETIKGGYDKHCYTLEGTGHNSSELVFNHLSNPLFVSLTQELQIWYGQDWIDLSESVNSGKVCVDVYAWYA